MSCLSSFSNFSERAIRACLGGAGSAANAVSGESGATAASGASASASAAAPGSPPRRASARAESAARRGCLPGATPAAPLDLRRLVGAAGWSRLAPAVQRRFALPHAEVTYGGRMDVQCSRAGRAYAVLARLFGGPLTALCARAVPTTVRVGGDGRGGMVWERRFHAEGGTQLVRTTKWLDGDRLVERTDRRLAMALVVFEQNGALVFESRGYTVACLGRHWRVPALLTPGACRVTHADLGRGRFEFTLAITHPVWGCTFRQSGVFTDPCAAQA